MLKASRRNFSSDTILFKPLTALSSGSSQVFT